jgi:hypothetical protein
VRAEPRIVATRVLEVVAAAERAWDAFTGALDFPPPLPDPTTGAYEIALTSLDPHDGDADERTFVIARDATTAIDRAFAATEVDTGLTGCALEGAVARGLARAIAFRAAPAIDEGTARAQSAYLASLVAPCAAVELMNPRFFQAHPERGIVDAWLHEGPAATDAFSRGAALFWSWLDHTYGREPGGMVRALWALAVTETAPGAARWVDEPDVFDVLRVNAKRALAQTLTTESLQDFFVRFGVARAFAGAASDGRHLPESAIFGESGRVRIEWEVPWPSSPRRFGGIGVAPSGSVYILVHAPANANANTRLRIEASWEAFSFFRWSVVKLDAHGSAIAELEIPAHLRSLESQMTVVGVEGVDRILLVGTNVGDPSVAFDPDDEEWEPHGWLVTVAEE